MVARELRLRAAPLLMNVMCVTGVFETPAAAIVWKVVNGLSVLSGTPSTSDLLIMIISNS